MKNKIFQISFLLFILFSCKKNEESNKEKLIGFVKNKVSLELDKNQRLEYAELIKLEPITESEEFNSFLSYSNYNLVRLSRKQKQIIEKIANAKNLDEINQIRAEYKELNDSINFYKRLGENILKLNPQKEKINYHQMICVIGILNKKTNTLKKDSLFLYIDKENKIFSEPEYVKNNLIKFK